MASIMTAEDAMMDGYDVFVADDTTSFLAGGFVADLQRRGIAVVGVYDPEEAEGSGRQRLIDLRVDDVIEADALPTEFLRVLARSAAGSIGENEDGFSALLGDLAGRVSTTSIHMRSMRTDRGEDNWSSWAEPREESEPLRLRLDWHRCWPVVAGRQSWLTPTTSGLRSLSASILAVDPNLRTAIDLVHNRNGDLAGCLIELPSCGFEVLGGLANRRDWYELRPADVSETVLDLARLRDYVIVNVSSRLEDLPAIGGPARYGVTRSMLALADLIVLVAAPTPVGVARSARSVGRSAVVD